MVKDHPPVDRARRSRLGTFAFLVVIGASSVLAWQLVADDAAPGKVKRGRQARQARVAGPSIEAAPESLPTSRPGESEALALAPEPGSIRGRVVDRGEIPLNHAKVRIALKVPPGQRNFALVSTFDEQAALDEDARFSHPVPGGGLYQVVAEADGFAPAIKTGVKPGEEVELVLDVGAVLAGTVVDRISGEPVEGAAVEVSVEKGAMVKKLETNARGEFRVPDLPDGKLAIGVDHRLYVPKTGIEQIIAAGEAASIRIELDSGKSIKGQVLAADDNHTIEGAIITVRKKKATTDRSGRFTVRGLESEMHELQVAAEGFQAEQRPINLSGSRVEAVAEVLLNRGATIRGRIQNDKSEPVANAELRLFETWGNWSYEDWATRHLVVKSGEDGAFKMTGIPPREWLQLSIRVRAKGYPETFEKGVKLTRVDDDLFVPITLRTGAVVSGRVVDQENRPVVGARVELRSQNTGQWWVSNEDPNLTVTGSGADGEFKFEGLGRATYTVTAAVRGFSNAWKSDLNLNEGASATNLILTVESGSPVKGIVVDADEKPVSGATVNIWTQKGTGTAVSDAEGKFVVESVPKGPYDVWAFAAGYAGTRLQKQTPNSEVGFRIVLKREAVLKGTVVDVQTKKPIEKFMAFLTNEEGGRPAWRQGRWGGNQSDPAGKFSVQAPQGTYRLEIFATGYVRARKEGISLQAGTEPEPVKIEMKRGGAIEGIVRGQTGQPEPWVQVFVGKDDGTGQFTNQGFSEHDGYFFVGDLDSGTYSAGFQKHEAPLLTERGISVGGDRPAFVEVQIENVATLVFDFVSEKPKDDEEVVVAANGEQPGEQIAELRPPVAAQKTAKPWRAPRVRVWVESVGGAPLAVSQDWNGNEPKFKPITRKDLNVPRGQERFSITVRDLPAGQYVLRATARGYHETALPFQVRNGARWRMPVEMKLLPKEQRANLPEEPSGRRRHVYIDENGIRREYWYHYEEE
jgi:protocatechuate 3,4-dioxygenase beta subunit